MHDERLGPRPVEAPRRGPTKKLHAHLELNRHVYDSMLY